jgi:Protein kinase domain/WD domain, G-beta repeat
VSTGTLTELSNDDRARLEVLLVEFDLGWSPNRLAAAVRELPPDGPVRRAALREMVKIDLERHGRAGRQVPLADYLDNYPELLDAGVAPADLVQAEADAHQPLADTAPGPGPATSRGSVHLPKEFGRYRIVRPLGRGGMGGVYLARDGELDRLVALKVPRFPPDDATGFQRFTREARAAANLDHPNVCRVYDHGRIDGLPFLTMAYVDGPTLADVLRDGPLPPRRAAELARDVARAMAYAHGQGVVHRDLKPGNVLIAQGGAPVVTDFGLASRDTPADPRLTTEGSVVGTPLYMSPEQVAGERAGPASDVYSLGVVLYEMLTGRPPFSGSRTDIFTQVLTKEPPPPSAVRPGLDPRLDVIIRTALAKKPADRFPDMAAFAAALDGWLTARSSRVRWASRWAARFVLGGGLVFLLLALPGDRPPFEAPDRLVPAAAKPARPQVKIRVPRPGPSGKPKLTLEVPLGAAGGQIVAVGFSADDSQIYAATVDRTYATVRRWDAVAGQEQAGTGKGLVHKWVSLAPDGRRFLAGGGLPTELKRVESGETVQKFDTGTHAQVGAVSRGGQRVIVGANALSAGRRARVYDVDSGESVGEFAEHRQDFRCVAISDDGKWAFSASPDRYALWEVSTGKHPVEGRGNGITCAVFLPKSSRVIVGLRTGGISVYDPTPGTWPLPPKFETRHKDSVTCLVVSADGRRLVSGSADRNVRIWNTGSGRELWVPDDQPVAVTSVAFSANGKRIVAGAEDRTWRVWDLPD